MVIGCGSIGERHLRNITGMGEKDVLAFDTDTKRLEEVQKNYGVRIFNSLENAYKENPDAVIICNPTALHRDSIKTAIDKSCHIFVEKPISHETVGVKDILENAREKVLQIMVGYNFRFNKNLMAIKRALSVKKIGKVYSVRAEVSTYLPDWHPSQDYRKGYSANKSMGGGVILDSIHEIDYLCWLFGYPENVFCIAGRLGSLEIDVEDTAEMILKFPNGIIGELHMDYLERTYRRNCEIIGEKGTILWDFATRKLQIYSEGQWEEFDDELDNNYMYVDEMKHFLKSIKTGENESDGFNGLRTLEIAAAAKESSGSKKMVRI